MDAMTLLMVSPPSSVARTDPAGTPNSSHRPVNARTHCLRVRAPLKRDVSESDSCPGSHCIVQEVSRPHHLRNDSATAAVHTLPGPVGGEPARDGIGEWYVEARSVRPHPGLHRDVPLLGGRGIQVDAPDDVVVAWVEDGEGETGAPREVLGVAAKVGEVLLERHAAAWWPVAVGIAGSRAY